MKTIKVRLIRNYTDMVTMEVSDKFYDELQRGIPWADDMVDVVYDSFTEMDEHMYKHLQTRRKGTMTYESDYQIETEDGDILWHFDKKRE